MLGSSLFVGLVIVAAAEATLKPVAIHPPKPKTGVFRQGPGGIPAAKGAAVAHYAAGQVDLSTYSGVDFNNGDVMSASTPTSIYLIFYNGPGSPTRWTPSQIVNVVYFVNHLFESHFGSILETYTDIAGFPISAYKIRVTDSVVVNGKKGVLGGTVGSEDVLGVITSQLHSKRLPLSSNAIYIVLTEPSVDETSVGFCTRACGWHNMAPANRATLGFAPRVPGQRIRYAFIGNALTRCPYGCGVQQVGPSGVNDGLDAMYNLLMHEITEAITDPDLSAYWSLQTGNEGADMCAWNYGDNIKTLPNGAAYNVKLGSRRYLLQQLWVNKPAPANPGSTSRPGGFCGLVAAAPSGPLVQYASWSDNSCGTAGGNIMSYYGSSASGSCIFGSSMTCSSDGTSVVNSFFDDLLCRGEPFYSQTVLSGDCSFSDAFSESWAYTCQTAAAP